MEIRKEPLVETVWHGEEKGYQHALSDPAFILPPAQVKSRQPRQTLSHANLPVILPPGNTMLPLGQRASHMSQPAPLACPRQGSRCNELPRGLRVVLQ